MTMKVPFTPAPLRRPSPAAVLLFTRPSVTPLSRTAFLRQPELLCEALQPTALIPGWPKPLKPPHVTRNLPT
jgi:hypothetical protein